MSERNRLLAAITNTIADYRAGEIPAPTPSHVERWINQFESSVQDPILAEMAHVLDNTYLPKRVFTDFISTVVAGPNIAGSDPCTFWRNTEFLNIQGGGDSQRDMLALFDAALKKHCGIKTAQCGGNRPSKFVYLDDILFTGNRIQKDISSWIVSSAPQTAELHVIVIGWHTNGQYYANNRINEAIKKSGKSFTLKWWRVVVIEDFKNSTDFSDVLRPVSIPADPATQAYVAGLGFAPVLRKPGSVGTNKFFSSEPGRSLLEQEFLKTGVRIKSLCPRLGDNQRPLGNVVLKTPGFGSMIVTYRNCPNNTPLALWAGNPWYPLFARKTN